MTAKIAADGYGSVRLAVRVWGSDEKLDRGFERKVRAVCLP